jgi:glutamine synthetase adenylyltransferase
MAGRSGLDARGRDAFRKIAPDLFAAIAETPDPDMTLNNLALVMAAHRAPDLLHDERFRKFILAICSMSPRFARGLARDPFMLESLSSDITLSGSAMPVDTVVSRNRAELRAGIRNILGCISFDELTHELTEIADSAFNAVLAAELHTRRITAAPIAIFALGKYGTIVFSLPARNLLQRGICWKKLQRPPSGDFLPFQKKEKCTRWTPACAPKEKIRRWWLKEPDMQNT